MQPLLAALAGAVEDGHGDHGMLVVRLQQRLPVVRVVDDEVLFQELTDNAGPGGVAQEGSLGRGQFVVVFRHIETDRRREVDVVLWVQGEKGLAMSVRIRSKGLMRYISAKICVDIYFELLLYRIIHTIVGEKK